MKKGKMLFTTTCKDYKTDGQIVDFSIYGIFNSEKIFWNYYAISTIKNKTGQIYLTDDIRQSFSRQATIESIEAYGKQFKTKEEGMTYIQDFKDKWEYGSNDTRQEKRDQKIDDILDK